MPDLTAVFTFGAQTKTLTIPSAKVADFESGWLETNPMLVDENGDDLFANTFLWFVDRTKEITFKDYKHGKKRKKAKEDAGIDQNIITET